VLQPGRRVQAHAHARWRARGDDVARQQGDAARAGLDQGGNVEDQVLGARVLAQVAVDPAAHPGVGAVEFVGRHDPRAHGAEGVEALAQVPLLVAHLHVARGHIVDDGVAEDVRQRLGPADVATPVADDDGQLGLVVDLAGHGGPGKAHVGAGGDHALGHLGEDDGPGLRVGVAVLEDGFAQFLGVGVVVAPHAPHVAARQRDG
jgi:hypothetical protein